MLTGVLAGGQQKTPDSRKPRTAHVRGVGPRLSAKLGERARLRGRARAGTLGARILVAVRRRGHAQSLHGTRELGVGEVAVRGLLAHRGLLRLMFRQQEG